MGKRKVHTDNGRLWFESSGQPMPDGDHTIETPPDIWGIPVEMLGKPVVFTDDELRELQLVLGDWSEYAAAELVLRDDEGNEVLRQMLTAAQVENLRRWMARFPSGHVTMNTVRKAQGEAWWGTNAEGMERYDMEKQKGVDEHVDS